MYRDLKWKIPLILVVILGCVWLSWPLKEKIALGLDLQGGMHLVLEVEAEKAVTASLERMAEEIKRSIEEADVELDRVSADAETRLVRIALIDELDMPPVDKVLEAYPFLERQASGESRVLNLKLSDSQVKVIEENAVQQGIETIRNRVDQFGVSEPTIQVQGERRILVQLPGIKDPERAIKLIGKTALLEFKLLDEERSVQEALEGNLPEDDDILYEFIENKETGDVTKEPYLVKKRTVLTGDTLTGAEVRYDQNQFNEPYVALTFNNVGAMIFQQVTRENIKKRLAIVLDGHVYSAPVIQDEIAGGRAQITGRFTTEEARDLAIVLRAGALPAPVIILENRTVGPSLGKDSIRQGIQSILWGGVLVVVFIAIYYRLSGLIAVSALFLNLVILVGALSYFGAALTLPGIAGILLTVGMAIDANVLIFERIREEIRVGKTVRAAIEAGYAKAFSTIVDANITTFIAAVVLFQFGTGPIKGFAITLSIGIAASMFTAVFVSRVIFDSTMSRKKINRLSI